ncbi:MAG: hypothetical protein KAY65_10960 [Planctomycetes bacterium]|nr:hypothetical protein [Planctomycetota bacterium]
MKVIFYYVLTCILLVLTGCSTNPLVKKLRDRGVMPASTAKLKFIGSKNDFGTDISVTTEDQHVIKAVWSSIYSATKTNPYAGFDFGRIEFYTSKKAEWPAATLLVNPTDDSFLETEFLYQYNGESDRMLGLMRCPGLHKLRMWHLEKSISEQRENPNKQTHSKM